MSKFSIFMKANKKVRKNEKYAPTASLTDEDGSPVLFEFRHITSKENEELRDSCTYDVAVTGEPDVFQTETEHEKVSCEDGCKLRCVSRPL